MAVPTFVVGWWYALLGILVSYLLGDVQPEVFAIGAPSSAVTGALGGLIGQVLGTRTPSRA